MTANCLLTPLIVAAAGLTLSACGPRTLTMPGAADLPADRIARVMGTTRYEPTPWCILRTRLPLYYVEVTAVDGQPTGRHQSIVVESGRHRLTARLRRSRPVRVRRTGFYTVTVDHFDVSCHLEPGQLYGIHPGRLLSDRRFCTPDVSPWCMPLRDDCSRPLARPVMALAQP